jgi:hypothetical protein
MAIDLNSTVVCACAAHDIVASTTTADTRVHALRIVVARFRQATNS